MPRTKKRKVKKLSPPENQVHVKIDRSRTTWDHVAVTKVPYLSHVPEDPGKMTEARKERIRRVIYWHNQDKTPTWIAEKLGTSVTNVRRDLTAAIVLTSKNMPYVPKIERQIMNETKTFVSRTNELMERVETAVNALEAEQKHIDNPKAVMAYSMLIGELRQTLELGAKLTGELQTGNRVNVLMFSGMVKKLLDIIHTETDPTTFLRIRDRLKLELQGQQPLGTKGGTVQIEAGEAMDPMEVIAPEEVVEIKE